MILSTERWGGGMVAWLSRGQLSPCPLLPGDEYSHHACSRASLANARQSTSRAFVLSQAIPSFLLGRRLPPPDCR
jgi:hypothetical protein